MLGRKDFTQDEVSNGEAAVERQLAAFDAVPKTAQTAVQKADHFNDLVLALDRRYVHRLRSVTGKDGTPLNELETDRRVAAEQRWRVPRDERDQVQA